MILIKPSVKQLWITQCPLLMIERAGRTCWKSEPKGDPEKFVRMLLNKGHEAMIEHASMSYRVICDRGVTHEIVRHRLFSYAQESTRYCNYSGGVTFIIPCWIKNNQHIFESEITGSWNRNLSVSMTPTRRAELHWFDYLLVCEREYKFLLKNGWTPQQARSVLPNSLKTEIVITGNMRQWRHFFKLRCDIKAHPQMQEIANMILADAKQVVKVLFEEF